MSTLQPTSSQGILWGLPIASSREATLKNCTYSHISAFYPSFFSACSPVWNEEADQANKCYLGIRGALSAVLDSSPNCWLPATTLRVGPWTYHQDPLERPGKPETTGARIMVGTNLSQNGPPTKPCWHLLFLVGPSASPCALGLDA